MEKTEKNLDTTKPRYNEHMLVLHYIEAPLNKTTRSLGLNEEISDLGLALTTLSRGRYSKVSV